METYRRKRFHNPLFNILTDEFDNVFIEKNLSIEHILENFYVDERSSEGITNERLYSLFTSKPHHINKAKDLLTQFDDFPGMVYLLLGKKGTGKTITLRHFINKLNNNTLQNKNRLAIAYLDLRPKKTDRAFLDGLPNTFFDELFFTIKREIPSISQYLEIPSSIKELDKSYKYLSDETLIQRVLDNKTEALEFLFNYTSLSKYEIYLIIDNVDDFPIISIKRVIDKCIDLKNKFNLKCIVALRDYWNPQNLNIDDTNICSCYLSKPDIYKIVLRRLETVPIDHITKKVAFKYGGKRLVLEPTDIIDTFNRIIKDLTDDKELHEELYQLSNYNTREHLRNIYNFFHSPYLYTRPIFIRSLIEKIEEIDPDFSIEKSRKSRFFDFLECLMAIHSLCYDLDSSEIFNVFFHEYQYDEGYNYQNTLIYIRILQSLPRTRSSVNKEQIIERLESVGYNSKAIRDSINTLLKKSLIESTHGVREIDAIELSISVKGIIYVEKLIYEYSYLQFICDAVPMPDKYKIDILEKFGNEEIPLERGNLMLKHESVNKFIKFIEEEEEHEESNCPPKFKALLGRIRYDTRTSDIMRDHADYAMSKMIAFSKRRTKKIEKVSVIND
jgi:hypothetical protein